MTATALTNHCRPARPSPVLVFLFFAAVAAAAIPLLSQTDSPAYFYATNRHMAQRHPGAAEAVIHCVNSNGAEYILTNPSTGRQAMLCWIPAMLKYGILIVDGEGREITAFIKDRMGDDINAIFRYLANAGYK